jgi:hypothetical protein
MQKLLVMVALSAGLCLRSAGALYSLSFDSGFQNGGVIPDGSLNGLSDTRNVSFSGAQHIEDLQVTLNFSGGCNGDLYAYLTHGSSFIVLLNRVGVGQSQGDAFGYADAGMHITLSTGGANGNIHWYGGNGIPTGVYAPDGRAIDPLSSPAAFDTASTSAGFGSALGLDPNGSWTLFFSDVSADGGHSTLSSWSMNITAAPEPVTTALAIFGLAALGSTLVARVRRRIRNSSGS